METDAAVNRVLICLEIARASGATVLQILAGQPPRMRVNGLLTEPIQPEPFHFTDTQSVTESILDAKALAELDRDGSIEVEMPQAWGKSGSITVFFGNGCHNLIIRLSSPEESIAQDLGRFPAEREPQNKAQDNGQGE